MPWRFLTGALLAMLMVSLGHAQDNASPAPGMPTLRITSPMGRTGAPATVRIVAQVQWPPEGGGHPRPLHFRFLVDGAVVGTLDSGPPYAVTWADENPFESREIVVEAEDDAGAVVRDKVTLPPYEITDETEVASILVDAVVYDAANAGRTSGGGAAGKESREAGQDSRCTVQPPGGRHYRTDRRCQYDVAGDRGD